MRQGPQAQRQLSKVRYDDTGLKAGTLGSEETGLEVPRGEHTEAHLCPGAVVRDTGAAAQTGATWTGIGEEPAPSRAGEGGLPRCGEVSTPRFWRKILTTPRPGAGCWPVLWLWGGALPVHCSGSGGKVSTPRPGRLEDTPLATEDDYPRTSKLSISALCSWPLPGSWVFDSLFSL